jgi:hypothetical protein
MNVSGFESLLQELGFTAVERRKKLRHASDPPTVYFNVKRNGDVYFTAYRKDLDRFSDALWLEIPAQQKKDQDRQLVTLLPVDGKETQAFLNILGRSGSSPIAVSDRPKSVSGISSDTSEQDSTGIFDESVASIEEAYLRLGHTLGWRFLTGPRATLSSRAEIGFITLNPGGDSESADHPRASCEAGNAYLTETWGSNAPGGAPLQRQVQMLFSQLANKVGHDGSLIEFMDTEVMSAYFIPFRSPSLDALPHRKESLRFAISLWEGVFSSWLPRLILTIDNDSFREIVNIFSGRPNAHTIDARRFPTGWGDYQADVLRLSGVRDDGSVAIARLPHLSRFQLFGNPTRVIQLDAFLEYIGRQLQPSAAPSGRKEVVMHSCERIVEAAKYLEANGFTQKQLSSIHHFSLKGRDVTFAEAYRYFGVNRELGEKNLAYAERLAFIADQYKAKAGRFSDLIAQTLKKWPLR